MILRLDSYSFPILGTRGQIIETRNGYESLLSMTRVGLVSCFKSSAQELEATVQGTLPTFDQCQNGMPQTSSKQNNHLSSITCVCIFRHDSMGLFSFSQMKDFINTYNQVTESCFCDCVHDFTSRRITKQEVTLQSCTRPLHVCCMLVYSSETFSKVHVIVSL